MSSVTAKPAAVQLGHSCEDAAEEVQNSSADKTKCLYSEKPLLLLGGILSGLYYNYITVSECSAIM